MRTIHKDAKLVTELLVLDTMTSKEAIQRRKAILEKIRKRGTYLANQEVMVKGGVFQVAQCSKKRTPCPDFFTV